MSYKQLYQGKHHLLASKGVEVCLDASPKRKLTSKELRRGSFSKCKRDANQVPLIANLFLQRLNGSSCTMERRKA